jgi:DNA polymerase III subunit epsilon
MNDDHLCNQIVLAEQAAQILEDNANFRVLRRIPSPCSRPYDHVANDCRVLAIVDCETTGLCTDTDEIIELAIQLVFVSADGEILGWQAPHSWLQQVESPLSDDVQQITGIIDAMLKDQQIDDEFAYGMLERADLIIAHNARFDAAFLERRFPKIAGKAWACSASEIDWKGHGFEGRGLQNLLMQSGWFTTAHRAAEDVWALFWLLSLASEQDGPTHLQQLLQTSAATTVHIDIWRPKFALKDRVKAAGYHWDAAAKTWSIEVPESQVVAQLNCLAQMGIHNPEQRTITARERHRPLNRVPIDLGAEPDLEPF